MHFIQTRFIITFITLSCLLNVPFAAVAEELTIVGTGSGTAILQALGDVFQQLQPKMTVSILASIGSGGGIKAVGRDEYLLGCVVRPLKENEEPYGLVYCPYAFDPIVFFTNTSVPIKELTPQ